ncbi:hypothetical protein PRIPAC_71521, partial [Pristionchus pacificus]|uniref:Uncharacterized protein n=1 Tax=Pristionchus pacificus TaxID=54126 RepID=A0A2A6B4G6_PRIPA
LEIIEIGMRAVTKGCGFGYCEQPGCNGNGLCCCLVDFCNSAPEGSLLMSLLAAATAMWLRL